MKITSAKFKTLINKDPAWAITINEPYEITDYCDMKDFKITHLSPLLTFSGDDGHGRCADFYGCKNLKAATGNFNGFVSFAWSGISEIKNLHIHIPSKNRYAVNFYQCKNLKIATGNYPGYVSFSNSGISEIKNLFVGKNEKKESAYFNDCLNLKVLSGDFKGVVDTYKTPIETLKDFNAPILVSNDSKILKKFYASKKMSELIEILSDKTDELLIKNLHPTIEKEIKLRQRLKEKADGIQLHRF